MTAVSSCLGRTATSGAGAIRESAAGPPTRRRQCARIPSARCQRLCPVGTDGKLWLEQAPFGTVPPQRQQIDANVLAFQPLDLNDVIVLGTDGNLWLEEAPFGPVPPKRKQIDGNVMEFVAFDTQNVLVLGTDGKLWLEKAPFGKVPPARELVDATVA
jgi:hypothetical protein